MSKIDKIKIDEIKQAITMEDILTYHGLPIKKIGSNTLAINPCPNCSHNNCFRIDTRKNTFKCFSCLVAGSVIDLEMVLSQCGIGQAIENLSRLAGLEPSSKPCQIKEKEMDSSISFIWQNLEPLTETKAQEILIGRGFPDWLIDKTYSILMRLTRFNIYQGKECLYFPLREKNALVGVQRYEILTHNKTFIKGSKLKSLVIKGKEKDGIAVESFFNGLALAGLGYTAVVLYSATNQDIPLKKGYVWLDKGVEDISFKVCRGRGLFPVIFPVSYPSGYDINDLVKNKTELELQKMVSDFLSISNLYYKDNNIEKEKQGKKLKGIYESNGKTFYSNSKKTTEIANFVCRILQRIEDDNKDVSWKIQLNNTSFTIQGKELLQPTKFAEAISQKGLFLYNTTSKPIHSLFIKYVNNISEYEVVKSTQYLGKVPGKSEFITNSMIVRPSGSEPLKNIEVPPGVMFYSEPGGLFRFWLETIEKFKTIYGFNNTISIVGFAFCSLHLDSILKRFSAFPLLFLSGGYGTGKSTLSSLVLSMFGLDREVKPFNFGSSSTHKSLLRTMARYRGCPLFLNEYVPNKKNNGLLSAIYDRESYSRARTDNTLGIIKSEMNASVMLASTRNISDYESQALISRCVNIQCQKSDKKGLIDELILNKEYLSSFIRLGLMAELGDFWTLFNYIQEQMIKNTKLEARIIFNYGLLLAGYSYIMSLIRIQTDETFNYQQVDIRPDLDRYVYQAKVQQGKTSEAGIGRLFLVMVLTLAKQERLTGALIDKNVLYFNLSACYGEVARFSRQSQGQSVLPDVSTIRRELKGLGYRQDNQKWMDGLNMKCYSVPLQAIGRDREFSPSEPSE